MKLCEQILDIARWAPSGDNTQPWRFEIRSNREFLVHGYDTRDHCVYDLDGWASQLSHGALLETIRLAATHFGYRAESEIVRGSPSDHIVYRVVLEADASIHEDPLVGVITKRTVQRRPMHPAALQNEQRLALVDAVQPYSVVWLESWSARWGMAMLLSRNATIRLTIPEAFAVHKAVIAWHCKESEDRLPAASLGADPMLLGMMRWAMSSWERVSFMNRYMGGTLMPRIMMDVIPGLMCGAHFALVAPREPKDTAHRIDAGKAVQRFWLTATRLNLQVQPSYTPLVFARYAREQRIFTGDRKALAMAHEIAHRLDRVLSPGRLASTVFLGRIGRARAVKGRSVRLPLERLLVANVGI